MNTMSAVIPIHPATTCASFYQRVNSAAKHLSERVKPTEWLVEFAVDMNVIVTAINRSEEKDESLPCLEA